jgi:hypothetical protein
VLGSFLPFAIPEDKLSNCAAAASFPMLPAAHAVDKPARAATESPIDDASGWIAKIAEVGSLGRSTDVNGPIVRVRPSAVMVVGEVIGGSVIVCPSTMMPLGPTTRVDPSASVIVLGAAPMVKVLPSITTSVPVDSGRIGGGVVDGGLSVMVTPSVTIVIGDVTIGIVTVSDPITVIDGDCGGEESCGGEELEGMELGGRSVIVTPSVVITVGAVTTGIVTVSEPMTVICGDWDWDSGGAELGGRTVIVWPSVVITVGAVTTGIVTVSEPMTVMDGDWDWEFDGAELGGSTVIVSPSVVITVGAVTSGSVTVSEPMTVMCGEWDWDSGGTELGGRTVMVWPSVVITVGAVTTGIVTVSDPITVIDGDWEPVFSVPEPLLAPLGLDVVLVDPGVQVDISQSMPVAALEVGDPDSTLDSSEVLGVGQEVDGPDMVLDGEGDPTVGPPWPDVLMAIDPGAHAYCPATLLGAVKGQRKLSRQTYLAGS